MRFLCLELKVHFLLEKLLCVLVHFRVTPTGSEVNLDMQLCFTVHQHSHQLSIFLILACPGFLGPMANKPKVLRKQERAFELGAVNRAE
jgi:hypothetical protein